MLIDEKNKFKSWSNLKKQMNDLLCDSLKDKITYFYTSYRRSYDDYGRATINYNKREIAAFSWIERFRQWQDINVQFEKMGYEPSITDEAEKVHWAYQTANDTLNREKWMPECILSDGDFINAATVYLSTDITTALHSDNYLLRIFAYMDRRVGKRTLVKIKDEVEKLPEWVKQFYDLRCEADGIRFAEKTDNKREAVQ